jgi:hypothetical protein
MSACRHSTADGGPRANRGRHDAEISLFPDGLVMKKRRRDDRAGGERIPRQIAAKRDLSAERRFANRCVSVGDNPFSFLVQFHHGSDRAALDTSDRAIIASRDPKSPTRTAH